MKSNPIINNKGSILWLRKGYLHRGEDKPACIAASGVVFYFKEGKKHRTPGLPAVIHLTGLLEFYYEGERTSVRIPK